MKRLSPIILSLALVSTTAFGAASSPGGTDVKGASRLSPAHRAAGKKPANRSTPTKKGRKAPAKSKAPVKHPRASKAKSAIPAKTQK